MKNEDLKQVVINYARQTSVKECALLFDGIVSYNTIYKWCKNNNLSYAYTHDQCKREIELYKNRESKYSCNVGLNRIIHTFQPHFFDIERELWQCKSIQQKLITNRKKYLAKDTFTDREILRGFKISGIHIGYSHFSPLWLKRYAIDEQVKIIYDPCGGWGHRLIGASISNVKYIYNDLWDKSYHGCKQIAQFLNYDCDLYNNDCTKFTPSTDYDCVFTCPPYSNVENYNNKTFKNNSDYNEFLTKMFKQCIKPSVTKIGIVINDTYEQNVIDSIDKSFCLEERVILGTTDSISHLNKTNTTKKEILLKFRL